MELNTDFITKPAKKVATAVRENKGKAATAIGGSISIGTMVALFAIFPTKSDLESVKHSQLRLWNLRREDKAMDDALRDRVLRLEWEMGIPRPKTNNPTP